MSHVTEVYEVWGELSFLYCTVSLLLFAVSYLSLFYYTDPRTTKYSDNQGVGSSHSRQRVRTQLYEKIPLVGEKGVGGQRDPVDVVGTAPGTYRPGSPSVTTPCRRTPLWPGIYSRVWVLGWGRGGSVVGRRGTEGGRASSSVCSELFPLRGTPFLFRLDFNLDLKIIFLYEY